MAEIGYRLIRAREARGLTLEDAERDTRISRRYLEALECEQFEVIPAPVYARGFLRSYSQYLGMDPGEMLALFPSDDGEQRSSPAARPSMDTPVSSTSQSRPTWRRPPRFDPNTPAARPPEREGNSRPRRREPPPQVAKLGSTTLAPPRPKPRVKDEEVVIGADQPAAPQDGRSRNSPFGGRPPAPSAPPADPIIGESVGAPARRLQPGGSGTSRAIMLVAIAVGAVAIVVLVALLVQNLGGGGDSNLPGAGTTSPQGTTTGGAANASPTASTRQGVVPNVVDLTEAAARAVIKDAGYEVSVLKEKSPKTKGTVTTQAPANGTALAPGSTVTIAVSDGP